MTPLRKDIPSTVAERIGDEPFQTDDIGRSDSAVLLFSDKVLKIEKTSDMSDNEYEILRFLEGKLRAPRVLGFARENGFNYLLMSRLEGDMACRTDRTPEEVSEALARGIRLLRGTDISGCPRTRSFSDTLAETKKRMDDGALRGLSPQAKEFENFECLYDYLAAHVPDESPVFSHGDYCLPNVFLSEEGVCGFVDLGRAGVSDRYEDIYMCLWSMRYNFVTLGDMEESRFSECERIFFEALGMERDGEKLRFYELLDEFWI